MKFGTAVLFILVEIGIFDIITINQLILQIRLGRTEEENESESSGKR